MALQRQAISINLAAGLDTKTDSKHVVPGMLTRLENGVYRKGMAIEKRRGHDKLLNNDINDTALGTGSALENFNDELLQYNNQKLYGYSENANKWIEKGDAVNVVIESSQVVKNTASQSACDSAVLSGVGVYAWEDSRGGVRASVVDETTGTILIGDFLIDDNGERLKCLSFEGYIYIFWLDSINYVMSARRINPLSPGSFDPIETISTNVNTIDPLYDVISYQGKMLVVHNVTGTTSRSIWLDADLNQFSGDFVTRTYATSFDNFVSLVPSGNTIYVLYNYDPDVETQMMRLTNKGVLIDLGTTINAFDSFNGTGVANADEDGITAFFEIRSGGVGVQYAYVIKKEIVGTTIGSESLVARSVGLWTKPFVYTDENNIRGVFVGTSHLATLQSTYFIFRSDGLLIGKQLYTNGIGLTTLPIMQNVSVSGAKFTYALLKKNRIVSENAVIFTPTGVMRTVVDFTNSNRFTAKQLGNNLLICGGFLGMYDGQSIVEHGFLLYPENISVQVNATGGNLPAGTYQIYIVFEWTDNFGQIHRSRPSVAASATTTGSTSTILVGVKPLYITRKNGLDRSDISVVGYMTEANGTVAYRWTSVSDPTYNAINVLGQMSMPLITDVFGLTSNEILYTTGSVLPNDPAPACSVIEVFQNRAWLGGLEEASEIYFSKENKSGFPVEFTDEFTKAVPSGGGRVSALTFVDDKLLAFKADRFFLTYGDGPNDTNTLGGFAELENISVDVGCNNPRSIATLPNGIIIKTGKGFYSIDSALNAQYIGAMVEEYNGQTVTSANLIPDLNEVRFTTSDGLLLTYNYYFGKWNTASNLKSNSSVLWKNKHVLLKTNGDIFAQNQSIFKDASAGYGMVLESGWISFGSLSSFKRVYELLFMGTYKSAHRVRVKVAYDNDPSWIHSGVYDPTAEFPVEMYGDDSPFGESGTVYGGAPIDYAIRVRLKRQKCSSIKFRFEELTESATTGTHEALTISDVGLLVGMKKGAVKKGQTRNMKLS